MADTRDGWAKAEILIGAVAALGSIAIPVALFVVGNSLSERQRQASDKQLQADRVERMLTHLASEKSDEKKLAVRVLEFFVAENQFPAELLPALVEIASTDAHEDVADTASDVLQKVAQGGETPVASAARRGLAALPARLNFHAPSAPDQASTSTSAAVADLGHGDVVVAQQAAPSGTSAPARTELRYFRKEDAAQAQQMAARLQQRGIKAELRDLSQTVGSRVVRPKSFDLVLGTQRQPPVDR
jgi:hypothetical protein